MPSSNVTAHELATGTADVLVRTGLATLFGWSLAESAGVAAVATVIIRDGVDTAGKIVAVIELTANGSDTQELMPNGVRINTGIFVDRVAGETVGAIYFG